MQKPGKKATTETLADEGDELYSLSYISRCRIPPWELAAELQNIQKTSIDNNRAAGLTGKLIYRHGHFVQRLEGPKSTLDETMDRIRDDHRHDNIKILSSHAIERRMYSDWQQLLMVTDGPEVRDLDALLGSLSLRPVQSADESESAAMLLALQDVPTSGKVLLPVPRSNR